MFATPSIRKRLTSRAARPPSTAASTWSRPAPEPYIFRAPRAPKRPGGMGAGPVYYRAFPDAFRSFRIFANRLRENFLRLCGPAGRALCVDPRLGERESLDHQPESLRDFTNPSSGDALTSWVRSQAVGLVASTGDHASPPGSVGLRSFHSHHEELWGRSKCFLVDPLATGSLKV